MRRWGEWCRQALRGVGLSGLAALLLGGCGGAGASPTTTLHRYLAAWSNGRFTAMRALAAAPPRDFVARNAALFTSLDVTHARFSAGALTRSGSRASAGVTARYVIPDAGTFTVHSTLHLVKRGGAWLVTWSPQTLDSALAPGERIALTRVWPQRAAVLGAGGTPLTAAAQRVVVGLVGERIRNAATVRGDLLAAGAPAGALGPALAAARAHPTLFEPVFTISAARFATLKSMPGPRNVYAVPGTAFRATAASAAVTPQLAAHLVGSVGPITAAQLHTLGPPYTATSDVGQSGLEASEERTLAGTPTTRIDADDAGGNPVTRLANFRGHPGHAVRTSIDLPVQRAAEAALAAAPRPDVALVAIRASTGQVLAVVSDPRSTYDTALTGAYPPGSTFKVLDSTELFREGLTPASGASCPSQLDVAGETFHNAEGDAPAATIGAAFTESCNTAFIGLALAHISAGVFPALARLYGLQRTPQLGVPAFSANIPRPASRTELAGAAIGQGRVTFSPLGMAEVAAAVDTGAVRAPRLVAGAPDDRVAPTRLPAGPVADLHTMMADVVASGTASGVGLPVGTDAKTGTAEYGSGPEARLKIDGWLMGWRGDIAFAIVTQNTGGQDGGPVEGPLIARFLDALAR